MRKSFSLSFICLLAASSFPQSNPDADQYRLGPEDAISVSVLKHPEFSGDFLVPANGVIQFPVAGGLKVSGLSLAEVRKQLTEKLKARLLKPEVSVTLKMARVQRFYVLGDVKGPGIYDVKPGWGVAEALSAAGGLGADVQQKDVRVTIEKAGTGEKIRVGLPQALSDGAAKVAPGDIVRFDAVQKLPVYVSGKVRNPGLYRLREDATGLLAAIAEAGGPTEDASIAKVRVVHVNGGEDVVDLVPTLVRGESSTLPVLASGDMVIVPEATSKFAILGFVSKPGYYAIPEGRLYTLSDAVALAEGADKRGRLSKVGLVRTENGKQTRSIYDLGRFLQKGDSSQNPALRPGDVVYVPETNRAELGTILSAISTSALLFNVFKH
ncbi:SLBB domain-containing protein [Fimbriimonas ginsengisoli]|nr:SLBB domain-containing protein [Fimbriimonas ginsengisoli]